MTRYTGAWDPPAVESFLTETRPIRLACHTPADRLWMLSLWYRYRDGAFHCATAADADVVRFLRANDEVAFEVSTNRPPYRGVRGNGTADLAPDEDKRVLSALVERYLGDTDSDLARWLLSPDREEVHVTVAPDRIHSWDYADRMGDDTDEPA